MRSLVPEATIRRLVLKNVSILFFGTQISNIVVQELVRTQEIIIRHPESKVVVGAIIIIEAICRPI